MGVNDSEEAIITEALSQARWHAVRAQGAGGQHVNKTATAVHLRLDLGVAGLPAPWRNRLLALADHRVGADGVVVIKAQAHRSQLLNRRQAFGELRALLARGARAPRKRHATRPPAASKRRRLDDKRQRGRRKALRARPGAGE